MGKLEKAVFVTAANQPFWRCLYQLLRAGERHGWADYGQWVIYDLGLTVATRHFLEQRFEFARLQTLDLKALPAHYHPKAGTYAWKPHLIWQELQAASGPLLWMDSATVPKSDPGRILKTISKTGVYLLRGQSALKNRCERSVLERLQVPGRLWGRQECFAGLIGFDSANAVARQLAKDWAMAASDLSLIAPENKPLEKHQDDQALLSCLALPLIHDGSLATPFQEVDISSGTPVPEISTRNKVGAGMPCWADPLIRAYYATAKHIDQKAHRLSRWRESNKILPR